MLDINIWIDTLSTQLKTVFGHRLLVVGLQGSYRRGEAHAESDIDVVVVLDSLTFEDLKRYKEILAQMPEREKACGFVGDRQVLWNWPKHELFQFGRDTVSIYGNLNDYLPPISHGDIIDSVKFGASGIYHACCHSVLHGAEHCAQQIKELYKSAFFVLLAIHYLRSGEYIATKQALIPLLTGLEQEILTLGTQWEVLLDTGSLQLDAYCEKLLLWSEQAMNERYH